MKIELPVAPMDKDGAARTSGKADKDAGRMGKAFDSAVREVGGRENAERTVKDAIGGREDAVNRADGELPETDEAAVEGIGTEPAADETSEGATSSEMRSLQSLLGALAGTSASGNGEARPPVEPADQRQRADAAAIRMPDEGVTTDEALAMPGASDADADQSGRGMRLDVLRMETHFEPRQDGMVLVRDIDAPKMRPETGSPEKSAVRSILAREAADVAPMDAEPAPIPVRFDEAVARLGRGGERSGEGRGRDGSAASQSAIAELAARRTASKTLEASTSIGSAQGVTTNQTTSPFALAAQVAGPIVEALGDAAPAAAPKAAPTPDTHLRMRAGGGALKTLTIQLQPEHLGTVDVSLRLNEGRLTLELAASQSDTASMLLDDRASLRKLLEHAGFSIDDAAITVVTRDSIMTRTPESADAGSPSRNSSGNGGGEERSQGRSQSGYGEDQAGRRGRDEGRRDERTSASIRSGNTYL